MESLIRRALAPFVNLREGESGTAALMFAYSFLAMTAYNIIKPVTRSKFISDLGADNLPWVQLGAGLLIGVLMQVYSRALVHVPRRWAIPATQAGCVVLLLVFWLLFSAGYDAASVGFYVLGLILGVLLISQFWTLANDIYDARHAKRLFGFIGGGASLGGASGAAITAAIVNRVGTVNLLLVAAVVMLACVALVVLIVQREERVGISSHGLDMEGVGGAEAVRLLGQSRHLQLISVIIACAAMGGAIVEQQLNMAAESSLGQTATDGLTQFLAQVTVYLSLIGFVVQIGLTSRIHALLGIGFALLILPVGLGAMGLVMLFNAALWAPASARILDTSLRYTVDKTTREVLFLPLPSAIKYRAKAFVDVTMDRFAKALGALLVLVLIKPWGLALTWQQLSYASLTLMVVWIGMALRARREYLRTFRRGLARHEVVAGEIGTAHADLHTVEMLVEELAHPDERRVLSAIDLLESLGKPRLITPLLLHHTSAAVRTRALQVLAALQAEVATPWLPIVERLLADESPDVRVAAARAVAAVRGQDAMALMRQYLTHADSRLVVTAAVALADTGNVSDQRAAEAALHALVFDRRDVAAPARLEVAKALGSVTGQSVRELLIPLLSDSNVDVACAAVHSVSRVVQDRMLYLPALISLLRHRRLKEDVRSVLLGYGDAAVEPLAHFLRNEDESLWVRRHIPSTLAHLPTQRAFDVLVETLSDRDGFVRYQALSALETLHRAHPHLLVRREVVEGFAMKEAVRFFNALTLRANLIGGEGVGAGTLLVRALEEKQQRAADRLFRLLGLLYPSSDIGAAWLAIQYGDARRRAGASEYLDNILKGALRKRVVLMIDDMPADERVHRANVLFGTRRRDPEDTLAQLIHDDDPVIAATAMHLVAERGLWRLEGDIEYALDHRDPHDWQVFEAASWALTVRRLSPDERRARWLEPVPAVELAERLRRIALFNYVSVDELFRFAATARQVRHERGRALYEAGLQPDTLQFLIDGEVRFDDGARMTAPGPLAFEEMLQGTPLPNAVHAVDVAVTLSLTEDEFLTLLSNNVEIAHGLFRMLADTGGGFAPGTVVQGRVIDVIARRPDVALQPMERVLVLQGNPLLSGASSAHVMRLGHVAREVRMAEGAVLSDDIEYPAIFIVLRGNLRVEVPGAAPVTAPPGAAVGVYETLTGVRGYAVMTAAQSSDLLRIDRRDLFDILADDTELLQALFGAVLRARGSEVKGARGDGPVHARIAALRAVQAVESLR